MVLLSENSDKNDQNLLGAKNNDSLSEKRVIVKFYTPKYRKCGKFNSKNDSRPCMGAFAFLKSVDFKGICGKCKNDSTGEIFVSIWTRNMACVLQFVLIHSCMTLVYILMITI